MTDPTGIVAAANVAAGGKPKNSASDILTVARARLDMAVSALAESREDEIDDLRFYAGSPDNHWQHVSIRAALGHIREDCAEQMHHSPFCWLHPA